MLIGARLNSQAQSDCQTCECAGLWQTPRMTPEQRTELEEALPVRNVCDEAALISLMEKNGETAADVVGWAANAWRASDFVVGVVLTKKRIYTLHLRDWAGDGAYVSRIFVSEL